MKRVQREGHQIVKEFDEERSAKQPGREKFGQMLDLIEQGKADAIICWKLNRLARNPIDGGRIQWLLQQNVIKAIITSEKVYLPSDNVIQMSVEFGMATQYSIDLSKDVKRGMLQKAKMGHRPGKACIGYINDYAGLKGEKRILTDEERSPLVRKCWDLLLTGAYTVPRIHQIATKDMGMTMRHGRRGEPRPVSLTAMYQMFTNPFYFGEFDWDGETYQGSHQPIITREEFEKAQMILGKKGKPRQRKYLHAYPGLIRCGECGAMIVVDVIEKQLKTTREVKHYRYYRCGHNRKTVTCSQRGSIREKDLRDQIENVVDSVTIPQAFVEWAIQKLKLSQEDRMQQHRLSLTAHQKGYQEVVEKIDKLVDRQLLESTRIPEDVFTSKLKTLEAEKKRLYQLIQDFDASASQWTEGVVNELNFALRLRRKFEEESRDGRLEILHRLGQTIQMKDGALDFRLQPMYQTFAEGKSAMQEALGHIQMADSLEKPLYEVESCTFEKVVSVWSG